jgi:hypothetical protein
MRSEDAYYNLLLAIPTISLFVSAQTMTTSQLPILQLPRKRNMQGVLAPIQSRYTQEPIYLLDPKAPLPLRCEVN